jgi:hypothetical protein
MLVRMSVAVFAAAALVATCKEGAPGSPTAGAPVSEDAGAYPGMAVYASADVAPVARSFFQFLPEANATVSIATDPAGAAGAAKGSSVRVALLTDLPCGECYQLVGSGLSFQVHGGNPLGAQYGLAQLLEQLGFRFFHPWQSKVPTTFSPLASSKNIGPTFTPEMTLRGLHLHTLHPIESYFTFWASRPSNGGTVASLEGAERVIDWIVKNRGNYVEWAALNDIVGLDPTDLATWRSHTAAIIAYAHARGIKIGIGAELFGVANLQLSYDLLDNENDPNAKADVDARWHLLTDGLAWDIVDISFGEFTGTDATTFLDALNLAYTELESIVPGIELAATVHVGNDPSLYVTYDGKTLLYYFLVQYADPHIVPFIHTVMYFDFFQNADGAYNMPNFDQHLAYLQRRLAAGQAVAYYPESAYWVAFDDSVPTYLPLYMRSRWLDQANLASAAKAGGYAPLSQSILFSSGWEWGYWQNDYATLRMNFKTPTAWTDPLDDMFAPWGPTGAALATQIGALGELQSKYLIDQALAPYLAGADAVVTLGWEGGIISQPMRTSFAALAAMGVKDRTAFESTVLQPLEQLDTETATALAAVSGLNLDPSDPWLNEVAHGFRIDADRAHFERSLYEAVDAFAKTGGDSGWLAMADAAFADAQAVVRRRNAALHYPNATQLLTAGQNATFYQTGFLTEAGTLCYWTRERIQARAVVVGDMTTPPGCVP